MNMLTFKPGETEKYLEIVPKDNSRGDGDRMFYVILGAPEGETIKSLDVKHLFFLDESGVNTDMTRT